MAYDGNEDGEDPEDYGPFMEAPEDGSQPPPRDGQAQAAGGGGYYGSLPYYSPMQGAGSISPDLAKWTLDPRDVIETVEHGLRRERYDKGRKQWLPIKDVEPLMNDAGIADIIWLMSSRFGNRGITLSNFKEGEVIDWMKEFDVEIQVLLFTNERRWGVRKEYFLAIINTVEFPLYATLLRAVGGGERNALTRMQKRMEHHITNEQVGGPRRGILGGIFGR